MVYFLPSDSAGQEPATYLDTACQTGDVIGDLRIFWGPDFCRLEYLIHLVETGRIREYAASELAAG